MCLLGLMNDMEGAVKLLVDKEVLIHDASGLPRIPVSV